MTDVVVAFPAGRIVRVPPAPIAEEAELEEELRPRSFSWLWFLLGALLAL